MADLDSLKSSLLVGLTGLDSQGEETTPLVVNPDGSINVLQVAGENIKVSSNDQTTGYLQQKIIGTTGKILVTVQDEGNDEKLVINASPNLFDKTVDTATEVVNTPSGGIAATNVQAALNELDSEKADKTTTIFAGAGLSGGGDLSANRTISMPNVGTASTVGATNSTLSITTDAQGRVTTKSASLISIVSSQISDFASTVLSTILTGLSVASSTAITASDTVLSAMGKLQAQITTLINRNINTGTGLTGGGNLSADRTLSIANTAVTPGTYGSSTLTPSFTVDQQGRLTFAGNITPANNIINSSATATSSTTSTSSSDVLINSMTLTPVAGTYLALFSAAITNTGTDGNVSISIYSGGAINSHSERTFSPQFSSGGLGGSPSLSFPVETHAIVTVNGSQAIEARWRRSTGTMGSTTRTLILIKVG